MASTTPTAPLKTTLSVHSSLLLRRSYRGVRVGVARAASWRNWSWLQRFPCLRAQLRLSLYGPAPGKRFTASQLDAAFELLLSCGAGLSDEEIKNYSVHSFRIFLACALLAAKCPRWLIMQMLRWRSEKSLDIYARVSDHEWSARLSSSLGVTVDASLVPRMPQIDSSHCPRSR